MRMVGAEYGTDLRGPTVCEVIAEPEVADVVAKLGPDPLRRDADGALAWARISKSRRPIGALLMDQTVIAGVGNVYRNELLYRHRIDPYRPGTHIDEAEFDAMWTDLVELMKVGFRRGKIIVVRPEDDHGMPSYAARAAAHVCLPQGRRAVPGVRHHDPHRGTRGPQPVLVPDLPDVAPVRTSQKSPAATEVAAAEVAAARSRRRRPSRHRRCRSRRAATAAVTASAEVAALPAGRSRRSYPSPKPLSKPCAP